MPGYLDRQIWRLVGAGMAKSPIEIERDWTLADVWDAHIFLDVQRDFSIWCELKR